MRFATVHNQWGCKLLVKRLSTPNIVQLSVLTIYTSDGFIARFVAGRRLVPVRFRSSVSVASEMLEFVLKRRPTVSKVRTDTCTTLALLIEVSHD